MRTLDDWLTAYAESHRNPVNKLIHRIAVPIIMFDILGFLHVLPVQRLVPGMPPASTFLIAGAMLFYLRLSPALALGMALVVAPGLVGLDAGLAALGTWAVPVLAAVFVLAWIAQFVGHALEGAKPSFFEDLQFLLVGPLWILADAYRRLGLAPQALRQTA